MFMQMKSRRRGPSKPCPCGGLCSCHKPSKDIPLWSIPLMMLFLFSPFLFLAWYRDTHPDPVRYIKVNGQTCIVKYVTDSCTSTGACSGHDEAVCPNESKR